MARADNLRKLEGGMTMLDMYLHLKVMPSTVPELVDHFGLSIGIIRWNLRKLMHRDLIYVCCLIHNPFRGPHIKAYTVNNYYPERGRREILSNCRATLEQFKCARNEYLNTSSTIAAAPNIFFRCYLPIRC